MNEKWQNLPFLGSPAKWYRYQGKVVPIPLTRTKVASVPLTRTKVVPVPRQSDTGTNFQNMIGTATNPSGTGTNASCNPDFWYSYIVKLKFGQALISALTLLPVLRHFCYVGMHVLISASALLLVLRHSY